MIIGFSQRRQTVIESDTTITLDVHSLRSSELDHEIMFVIYSRYAFEATVESVLFPLHTHFDAQFGIRQDDEPYYYSLVENHTLYSGDQLINGIETIIYDDQVPEREECYTIYALWADQDFCYHDYEDYFCYHTICIKDNDGYG